MNNINSENLASVVKEQTVEYREQNHCFNTENHCLMRWIHKEMKKYCLNDEKHCLKQQVRIKPTVLKRLY